MSFFFVTDLKGNISKGMESFENVIPKERKAIVHDRDYQLEGNVKMPTISFSSYCADEIVRTHVPYVR
jgi:hypothetical protein